MNIVKNTLRTDYNNEGKECFSVILENNEFKMSGDMTVLCKFLQNFITVIDERGEYEKWLHF
jgi:hypothetical protein